MCYLLLSAWEHVTVGFQSNRHPSMTMTCLMKFWFCHLAWRAVTSTKFHQVWQRLSHSINIHSKVSGSSKPPGRKLDINEYKSQKIPHMVKCHIRTFHQDLSVTCDKSQILACQVPSVTHDR
jgi:hypothetical protein